VDEDALFREFRATATVALRTSSSAPPGAPRPTSPAVRTARAERYDLRRSLPGLVKAVPTVRAWIATSASRPSPSARSRARSAPLPHHTWTVRVPRRPGDPLRLRRATDELTRSSGALPTVPQLASNLGTRPMSRGGDRPAGSRTRPSTSDASDGLDGDGTRQFVATTKASATSRHHGRRDPLLESLPPLRAVDRSAALSTTSSARARSPSASGSSRMHFSRLKKIRRSFEQIGRRCQGADSTTTSLTSNLETLTSPSTQGSPRHPDRRHSHRCPRPDSPSAPPEPDVRSSKEPSSPAYLRIRSRPPVVVPAAGERSRQPLVRRHDLVLLGPCRGRRPPPALGAV